MPLTWRQEMIMSDNNTAIAEQILYAKLLLKGLRLIFI